MSKNCHPSSRCLDIGNYALGDLPLIFMRISKEWEAKVCNQNNFCQCLALIKALIGQWVLWLFAVCELQVPL